MRLAVFLLLALVAVFAAGWWLVPLVIAHAPVLIGAVGALLLIVALVLPTKPVCTGMHCSGCARHH